MKIIMKPLLVLTAFALYSCASNPQKESEQQKYTDYNVKDASEIFAKKKLKSPSTAQFAPIEKDNIIKINDSTFKIQSYVDSENGFGAMIRRKYKCELIFNFNNTVTCTNLLIDRK